MDGPDRTEPSVSQRRLAAELRRLRDLAGLSGREMAHRLGVSQSKVSRIESCLTLPTAPEVAAWSTAVNAPTETVALLESLTEAAFTEVHRWSHVLRNRPHLQGDIQEVESGSHHVMVFQNAIVPGLLQTAEYARRVFAFFSPEGTDADLSAAVAGRLNRQLVLFDQTRRFEFLLTEAALRWRPGPARLLLAQLDRISSLATLENVTVGLLPHRAEAVTYVTHGFALFDLRADTQAGDGEAIAMVETVHANLTVSDPESIALYRHRWRLLKDVARYGDDARLLLDKIAAELRAEKQ
ncbi:helix-turn-helix transcriptional regulator [Actinomadura sp. 7K534]|uniref:helix-turn-helix domain-containing protein n=1 Tax=Actinomadura sp. 7K534 TaxID=2530366 RepID=UPI0010524F8D|nr:helix-turn-helix transcriptional regulator [Actinomadura sp. 7K534]TDB96399.1 XRE family transcriptional regulator [Actinomadura sp. 7K534]